MTEKEKEILFIIEKLKEEKYDEINDLLKGKRPYDMAEVFQKIPERHRAAMLHHLEPAALASMMQKLKHIHQFELLSKIGKEKASKVLALLDTSIISSLLRHYPKADIEFFFKKMEENNAEYIKKMMEYPDDSAGSLMTNRYIALDKELTVKEAVEKIRALALFSESVEHVYVVNESGEFEGTIPYKDLVLANPEDCIKDIMLKNALCINANTKRAEITRLLRRDDFTALPVVDDDHKLVGVITFDDMLHLTIEEAKDDYGKFATASKEIDFGTKPFRAAIRRIPWLIALLLIGLVSGSIIAHFEATLDKVVALAFFMPLIAGMTGNTGTQSLAIVVRGLSEGDEMNLKTIIKLIFREFRVSLIIGLTCGFLIFLIAFIWQGNLYLGFVVGSSLLMTLILGTLAGTIIPIILYKIKLDPAVASGPLITTVNDIFSLVVYFSIATMFLSKLM
ncbi:magnesium transporter [Pueribacillus theae]|nr:magnesium transporter [Pueribacillus theae]